MTKQVTTKKATRKIHSLDFSGEGHAIALVGPIVGGPANGYETLITKSARSEDFIKKASMVNVNMEITEFLRKFFYMYSDDAEVLARALGFTTAMQDDEVEDASEGESESEMDWEEEYSKYIQERVSSFTIMKSLSEAEDIDSVIAGLSDDEFLSVLVDQEQIEKSGCIKPEKKQVKKSRKENKLPKQTKETMESTEVREQTEVQTQTEVQVEVQKSVHEVELEKAQLELKKALEELEVFKQREKETKLTGRKQEIVKAVGVEEQALAIFEGVKDSSDEVFAGVVKALADISKAVAQSDLFNETGTTVEDNNDGITVDGVEKILKAKYTINK